VSQSFRLLYPAPPARRLLEADVKIPVLESVVEIYGEAATAAAAGALRAAAVMYRAAVEAICDALDVPTTAPMKNGSGEYTCKLYDRIDELRSRSIDDDLVTDRHEARMMGTTACMPAQVLEEEVEDVAELIRQAVDVLFVIPARTAAMRAQRQTRRANHAL
jgi:hypothetical protein